MSRVGGTGTGPRLERNSDEVISNSDHVGRAIVLGCKSSRGVGEVRVTLADSHAALARLDILSCRHPDMRVLGIWDGQPAR